MKTILFDLDGTLLDTLQDLADSVRYAFRATNLPEPENKAVRKALGNGARNLIETLLPEGKKDLIDETLAVFRAYYQTHSHIKTCPYDGIPALLEKLTADGYKMGVVSNKPDSAVKVLGETYFSILPLHLGEREGIKRKPNPDPIEFALKELGGKKENCLYVGDSEVDVKTGENTGIPCIAVTWGFRDRDVLEEAGAKILVDTAEELYQKIRELL